MGIDKWFNKSFNRPTPLRFPAQPDPPHFDFQPNPPHFDFQNHILKVLILSLRYWDCGTARLLICDDPQVIENQTQRRVGHDIAVENFFVHVAVPLLNELIVGGSPRQELQLTPGEKVLCLPRGGSYEPRGGSPAL